MSEENSLNIHFYSSMDNSNNNFDNPESQRTNPIPNYSYIEDGKKTFLICSKCGQIPKVYFSSLKLVNILCDCHFLENTHIDNIYNYFVIFFSDKIKIDNYTCINHNKKYRYYCTDCEVNICKHCKTKDNRHKTHTPIILCDLKDKYKIIEEKVKQLEKLEKGNDLPEYIKLIEDIYDKFPNYNLYETILSLYQFCCNSENKKLNPIYNVKNEIKITSLKELKLNEELYNLDNIMIIEIIEQDFNDLNYLCELKYEQLNL